MLLLLEFLIYKLIVTSQILNVEFCCETLMNVWVPGQSCWSRWSTPTIKGVVRATSRDSIWHHTGRELGPLPWWVQGRTKPVNLYHMRVEWLALIGVRAPHGSKELVPWQSGIRAKSDRGGPNQESLKSLSQKFLKVLAKRRWWEWVPGVLVSQYDTMSHSMKTKWSNKLKMIISPRWAGS